MTRVRRLQWGPVLWMTAAWCLLWGEVTVGNVLAGAALGVVVVTVFPLPAVGFGVTVRPWPLVVLVVRFLYDLVVASIQVSWLAVRPRLTHGVVVDLELRGRNPFLQTLTAEMVGLVPGTVVIDLHPESGILTLHVLEVSNRAAAEAIRRDVLGQEARVIRALDRDPQESLDPRRRRERDRRLAAEPPQRQEEER